MSASGRRYALMRRIAADESKSSVVPVAERLYAQALAYAEAETPAEELESRTALLEAAWSFVGALRAATRKRSKKPAHTTSKETSE